MNKRVKDLILIVAGSFFFAVSVSFFAIPNRLAEGGVTGLSMITFYLFEWSPSLTYFIINGVLLIIGIKLLQKRIVFNTILTIILTSFFLYLTEGLGVSYGDPLIGAIFAGVTIGFGTGLIFRAGSSSGGTTIIAKMFNQYLGWDLTNTMFILDTAVVVGGYFVIGPLNTMYTIVALYIGKKVIDFIVEGVDTKKAITLVSNAAPEIVEKINNEMGKSATILAGYGSYSKESKEVVYVIIHRQEVFKLKNTIRKVDENAFVVIHDVRDVFGGGFSLFKQ